MMLGKVYSSIVVVTLIRNFCCRLICPFTVKLNNCYRNPSHQHGGHLKVREMGNFTAAQQLHLSEHFTTLTTIKRRMNMQEIELKVMAVITQQLHEPFQEYLQQNHEPHRDSLSRFTFVLLDIIKEMFNLT